MTSMHDEKTGSLTSGVAAYIQDTTPSHSTAKTALNNFATTVTSHTNPSTLTHRYPCRKKTLAKWLRRVSFFFAFHASNSLLGLVAFVVTIVGLCVAIALLPLCGFGVIVFQALEVTSVKLARLDVAIANLLFVDSSSGDQLRIHPAIVVSEFAIPNCASAETETSKTSASVLSAGNNNNRAIFNVMLYFATVKIAISILSCFILTFAVTFPVLTCSTADVGVCKREYADKPIAFIVTVVGICLFSSAILVPIAIISSEFADLVCADPAPSTVDVANDVEEQANERVCEIEARTWHTFSL